MLDDAVAATLEMESYVESTHNRAGAVSTLQPETKAATVAVIGPVEKLTRMVERLTEQVEATRGSIESETSASRRRPRSSPKISGGKTGAGELNAQAAVEDI